MKLHLKPILDFPKFTIFACFLFVCLATLPLPRLTLISDYQVFFDQDNEDLKTFNQLRQEYVKDDSLMLVISHKDQSSIYTARSLKAIQEITDQAWSLDFVKRVSSLSNFQNIINTNDNIILQDLIPAQEELLSTPFINNIKHIVDNEPALQRTLINNNGTVSAIIINYELPGLDQMAELPLAIKQARAIQAQYILRYPNLSIRLAGQMNINYAFTEAALEDFKVLNPLSILLIILAMYLFLRHWAGLFASMIVIQFSIIISVGIYALINSEFSPPMMVAPTIIMTLAVADCLHFISNFNQSYHLNGDKISAIKSSFSMNYKPIIITSLTTAIGFLSLNFSYSPPFRNLGNLVAIGVIVAMLLSLVLLPALLSLLPITPRKQKNKHQPLNRLANIVIKKSMLVSIIVGTFSVVAISGIFNIEANDTFNTYFDSSLQVRKDIDFVTQHLASHVRLHFSIPAKSGHSVNEMEYLHHLEKFEVWLKKQPEVVQVSSYLNTLRRLNRAMHQGSNADYVLPSNSQIASQYMLLYQLTLPYGQELTNEVNMQASASKMTVGLIQLSSLETIAFDQNVQRWMQENWPDYMHTDATSAHLMISKIGQLNVQSMLKGCFAALLLISALLIMALKSPAMGVLSLIPNLLPALIAFGLWGIFVGEVGLSLAPVMGMTLGIVVDFSVHFLSKYLNAKREMGLSEKEAILYGFNNVGTSLCGTALVLVIGFAILGLSPFSPNADMGILTALTISIALLVDLLLLPSLIMLLAKRKLNND